MSWEDRLEKLKCSICNKKAEYIDSGEPLCLYHWCDRFNLEKPRKVKNEGWTRS